MRNILSDTSFDLYVRPGELLGKPYWIILHKADAAEQVQDQNSVCVEWLGYQVRKFARLLETKSLRSKIWANIVCTIGNLALPMLEWSIGTFQGILVHPSFITVSHSNIELKLQLHQSVSVEQSVSVQVLTRVFWRCLFQRWRTISPWLRHKCPKISNLGD